MTISIIDYGMGNLRSVQKAFEHVGAKAEIITTPEAVRNAERLVLPGVGAFRDAMAELEQRELADAIREYVAADRPFLGICLGLQLLFDVSYEDGTYRGLGIIPGQVVKFVRPAEYKIPHMGWNNVRWMGSPAYAAHVPSGEHFYFVHSYHVVPQDANVVAGICHYGGEFVAAVARGALMATQFHPEKSQRWGLKLLAGFAAGQTAVSA